LLFELTIGFATAQASAQNAPPPASSFLMCGHVWDGKSETSRGPAVIRIVEEKIAEVKELQSTSNSLAIAGKDQIVDLSHETCLPGLIDTHTHILLQGDITAADYDEQLLKQSPEYRTILATVNARRRLSMDLRRSAIWRLRARDMRTSM